MAGQGTIGHGRVWQGRAGRAGRVGYDRSG
jgi:hypothetical protein